MSISGFYKNSVIGDLRPPGQILQWNIDGVDPSGYRHFESGVYKPYSKIGLCGGFTAQKESGVALDFGEVVVGNDAFYTNTVCVTFNLGEVNKHPDSYFDQMIGLGENFQAFNARVWMANQSAFGALTPDWYYLPSATWRRGLALTSDTVGTLILPSSLPDSANMLPISDDAIAISGTYSRQQYSRYVYLVGLFPSGNHILGTYGGLGGGDFGIRISYDWTNINARILSGDI